RRQSEARIAELKSSLALDDAPIDPARLVQVNSANDPETESVLQELKPKVVVVNGTRILSRRLLSSVPAKFINTHAGITPSYRGVHGGYWALVKKDPDACGVTVHLVDEGIDTGLVLGQELIRPTDRDNFVTYPYLQLAAALPLLQTAVRAAL